ncbi:hypothetical protein NCCP2716_06720 [Sporosarcina sp. NCCP-2716]|uniref:AAA domain-containing protein n=1 Tax=Sporosarcina sp. NCCP-2716 TaxID=2943679 RepID=UPI00203A71A5|nr:AAA domain-containing protein [Sporosarcina sp. NCCP-2716]GKV68174.1 hypothetical protein NCCP2716_06720 [Sporosarcina sp. NCCP-2716]
MNRTTYEDIVTCELTMTSSARKGIEKVARDEHAFFAIQKTFIVHIEKRPENQHGNASFSFFFDNEENGKLMSTLDNRVAVLDCIVKNDGFLAVGFHVRGRREPAATNRRLRATVRFRPGKSTGRALPIEFAALLRELPVAEKRSDYVKKRIGGWEGYLRIMEKNADVEDIQAAVQSVSLSQDFQKLTVNVNGVPQKSWKGLPGFAAKFSEAGTDLGNVTAVNRKTNEVEISLKPAAIQQARKTGFRGNGFKMLSFSNFAELSQVRRLRNGFKDLQDGLAANANLEMILFEERPVVKITNRRTPLEFDTVLNEFQEEAVTGAMNASDVFVIQGPPGTGKTTVISEICNQAVKAGLRTLVASQANLAVDNALGRLLHNSDIRILRYGRTESIEEEGRKYIEENVAEHWRQQTIETTEAALSEHSTMQETLSAELQSIEGRIGSMEAEKEQLLILLAVWKEKQEEKKALATAMKEGQRELHSLSLESEKAAGSTNELERKRTKMEQAMAELEDKLGALPESAVPETELKEEQERLRLRIELLKNARSAAALEEQAAAMRTDLEYLQREYDDAIRLMDQVQEAAKLNDLNDLLDGVSYTPAREVEQMMITLIRRIDAIQEAGGESGASEWTELLTRTDKAITMVTDILHQHHFQNRIVTPTGYRSRHSLASIQQTVNRVGRYLVQPNVKEILRSTSFSVEAYDCLENLTKAVSLLHDRRNFIRAFLTEAASTADLFRSIKERVCADQAMKAQKLSEELAEKSVASERLNGQLAEIRRAGGEVSGTSLTDVLAAAEQSYMDITGQLSSASRVEAERNQALSELRELQDSHGKLDAQLEEKRLLISRLEEAQVTARQAAEEMNRRSGELDKALAEDPSVRLAELERELAAADQQAVEIGKQLEHLPLIQSLQTQWHSMLRDASPYDLDEIRKLYVKHANVIGTTCVASARKEFAEEYPQFDLVIIDEVSKATPPELLLPMLKGKKIILVGDHHQLPPLVGQETMEEFLEELPEDTEKREMEKLLKESLFERLFRTLPKQNKTMLGKQYRMHENIMQTITPFYNENGYALTCGLTDSDAARTHGLETRLVKTENHLLWLDMPNTPPYFEAKPNGGTSRYNDSELTAIRQLLEEMEEGTAAAIAKGILPHGTKKKVGVISFYGEQVKRIDRLLQEDIQPEHLEFRTGSVDKFQGMEMDIIIVSFVRNHGEPSGDIGFAKDYRRLNVALSRAKELLVIVGSSAMFTEKPKQESVRSMYRRLYETVERQNGLRSPAEPVRN